MAQTNPIQAEKRDFSRKPKQLRADGKIPATVYGPDFSPHSIQADEKSLKTAMRAEKTSILKLDVEKQSMNVLAKNVQYDPQSGSILNIEFYKVKSDEKLKVSVPVELVNVSPGVKKGGKVWNPVNEIEVECMPDKIPESIKVDLAKLENPEDSLTVAEIDYPEGVTPVSALESTVVKIKG